MTRVGFGDRSPPKLLSLDMLLKTYFGVNNDAKIMQIGDNFGWSLALKCEENICDTIKKGIKCIEPISWTGTQLWESIVLLLQVFIVRPLTLKKIIFHSV